MSILLSSGGLRPSPFVSSSSSYEIQILDATEALLKSLGSNVIDKTILSAIKQWTVTPTDQLVVPEVLSFPEPALDWAMSSQAAMIDGWTNLLFVRGFVSSDWGLYTKRMMTAPSMRKATPKL